MIGLCAGSMFSQFFSHLRFVLVLWLEVCLHAQTIGSDGVASGAGKKTERVWCAVAIHALGADVDDRGSRPVDTHRHCHHPIA